MGAVRDALSCICLAALGTYAAVSGDPHAGALTAATAAGAGLATGIAANLGFSVQQAVDRAVVSKVLRGWRGIDENHVVVQALRRAYLDALRDVLKTYRQTARTAPDWPQHEAFANSIEEFAGLEWTEVERLRFVRPGSLTPTEFKIRQAILKDLPTAFNAALLARQEEATGQTAARAFERLRQAIIQGAMAEIESRTLPEGSHAPPMFRAIFEGTNVPDSWFDLFIRAAAERLKNEHPFEAIWNAEQVAYISQRLTRLHKILEIPFRAGAAPADQLAGIVRKRPNDLLLARFQIVPYVDYHGALEELLSWARSPQSPDAAGRLYVAAGGYGKTRLAIELILQLEAEGWDGTFLSSRNAYDYGPGALRDMIAVDEAGGLLIVIDYAESQITLLKRVAQEAAEAMSGRPIRVLALARSAEGWWKGIQADESVAAVFEPAPYRLIAQRLSPEQRDKLFETAVAAFRRALTLAEGGEPARRAASTEMRGRDYDRPLTVSMAAFLHARGAPIGQSQSVFERVFLEECRHWKRMLHVEHDNDPVLISLHRAAAQITLVQGATPDGAAALLKADPRAAEYGRATEDRCLHVLETIYGTEIEGKALLRPVEPDLLGEHGAMSALAKDRDGLLHATLKAALAGAPLFAVDASEILTVLARATRPEHDQATVDVAKNGLSGLCQFAAGLTSEEARELDAALPRFAVPLLALSAAVARRVAATAESPLEEARSLHNLGIRLSESGDRARALAPARRAVEIYEALAGENPAAYRLDLAGSLHSLGISLSDSGDRAGALAAARRAVEIYETLAEENPAAYRLDLAGSLHSLGISLSESGDRAGALAATRRAVEIREALAEGNPAAYRPDLAGSLDNLGNRLSESGDRAGGLAATRRAVEINEALAEENPAAYRPDLARSLHNLGNRLSESGDRAGALAATRRAVEIREALAEGNPAAYRPDLARSLANLGIHLSESGDRAGALAAARRAVKTYEALAGENPAAYRPDLARSLHNLGNRLSESGDRAGALAATRRAVEIREALAEGNPAAYRPDLARSLANLGIHLSESGDRAGALAATRRAVKTYEALAEENPAAYRPDLARSLHNLGNRLSESGDRAGALAATRRAVEIREALAEENPGRLV